MASREVTTILSQSDETYEDDVGRKVFGHQTLHLCENLTRRLLVLECEAGVNMDSTGNVRKEVRVRVHKSEVHVSQHRQPAWQLSVPFKMKAEILQMKWVCSLVRYHHRRLGRPESDEN